METTRAQRFSLWGVVIVFIGAIFFSSKAVLVKLAYRYDIDGVSLLALRMLFSLPLFLLVAFWSRRRLPEPPPRLSRRDLWQVALLGLAGYYIASLFDFLGLQYVSAGMERLILFMYPTLVVLIGALMYRQPVKRLQLVALAITYSGIALAFAGDINPDDRRNLWLGASLIFVSALTYAIFLVGSGRMLPRLGTVRFTSLTMTFAAAYILAQHGITRQWRLFHFPAQVYGISLLMAVFATVLPSFMVSEGIRRIGSGNAAIVGSIGPVSTIIMAYFFLDERMGALQWAGTVLVIIGVLVISLQKSQKQV